MSPENPEDFSNLLEHIRRQRGIDFASYKSSTLKRRIEKRMQALGIEGYPGYLDYLQASPDEFGPLLDTLFINVTSFFRDAEAWQRLRAEVIPRIIEEASADDPLRVWCAGVASGEEAYTVAMLLADAMGLESFTQNAKIFATDIDDGVLAHARAASYTAANLEEVPEDLKGRYFEAAGGRFNFRSDVRRAVIFGRHNLLEDAPISRLRLLICRNTLMYFNREAQGRIRSRFHFALRPEGYLFLGKAEMLLTRRALFEPSDGKARLFRKVTELSFQDRLAVISHVGGEEEQQALVGEARLRDIAFDASPVAEIVLDMAGNLALANAAARATFRIGRGDIGRPFQDLELSYKPVELRGPIEHAQRDRQSIEIDKVEWRTLDGRLRHLDVRVQPLQDEGALVAVKVTFQDVTRSQEMAQQLTHSKRDLETAYEELQSSNEELETTNEELQSTVEELETTNEELQSTNEELETMNEELQSTNVEIETVNEELRNRSDELDRVNQYTRSVLDGMGMGVVVLDRELRVKIWNSHSKELWGMGSEEVEGRSFFDLDIGLAVRDLRDILHHCLEGNSDRVQHNVPGHDRKGKLVVHEVTCVPLHAHDARALGVIVMVDVRNPSPADARLTPAGD